MLRSWFATFGILALATLSSAQQPGQADQGVIVCTKMTEFFTALKNDNEDKYHSLTKPEFFAFDGGKRLSRDAMLQMMKTLHAAGNRYAWKVTDPEVHVSGNVAWIAYTNVGSVTNSGVTKPRRWLESAVLKREHGQWRLAFAQSSPVLP